MNRIRIARGERGFTIVEMMIAVLVILVGGLGTLAMLDTANKRARTASDRQTATALARQVLEAAKGVPYRDVQPASIVSRLRQDDAIRGISANPWRIERDKAAFDVDVDACWLDEKVDGLGSRAPGHFCPGTGPGGTLDGNSIDHKRITVTVSWTNESGEGSVRQSTLVSARGGLDAPGVRSVELTSPSSSPIADPLTTSASFTVTTTEDAAAVVWSLDGTQQETAVGSTSTWTFSWSLPPADGFYDVSAQAFDAAGLGGEVRSVTVVINRFVPVAPENIVAVRNTGIVEIRWSANRERDVIGYRVYRQAAGGDPEVVCDTTDTTCFDSAPPARTGSPLDYWVVALDRDPQDAEREGDASVRVDVNEPNSPPDSPANLVLAKDVDGNNVLQWTAPVSGDPDGDAIDGYVIYRDGTAINDRYDQVAGTQFTFVDYAVNGTGVTHEYWVAAIDSRFAESIPIGPVTG